MEPEDASVGLGRFRLTTQVEVCYEIVATRRLLDPPNTTLADCIGKTKAFCLVDQTVHHLYWPAFENYFASHSIACEAMVFDSHEGSKTLASVETFALHCLDAGLRRRDHVVCIGGGITCDVGALTASLLRRGTPCVKIPTSLMAVIDAAVGVKTGVNFAGRKNVLGTYSAPGAVLYDLDFLTTLPARQIRNGLVEIIKIIALKDAAAWAQLENHLEGFFVFPYAPAVTGMIERAIALMLEELQTNLFEWQLLRIVDYGHEFGHPIEVLTDFALQHGEAVGIGMLLANQIASRQGILDEVSAYRFTALYRRLNLPLFDERLNVAALEHALEAARIHKNGSPALVALRQIGVPTYLSSVSRADLSESLEVLRDLHREMYGRTFMTSASNYPQSVLAT